MELADVTDSKSVELITRVGSSPTAGTEKEASMLRLLFCHAIFLLGGFQPTIAR